MEIRKVEEKPMVLHTRKKPTLHIQKKKKLTGNDKPKSYIQVRGKGRADKKEKADSSVKIRNRKLYTMASVSVKKASEQMDGGEEIRDSVEMIQTAVHPVQPAAERGNSFTGERSIGTEAVRKRETAEYILIRNMLRFPIKCEERRLVRKRQAGRDRIKAGRAVPVSTLL